MDSGESEVFEEPGSFGDSDAFRDSGSLEDSEETLSSAASGEEPSLTLSSLFFSVFYDKLGDSGSSEEELIFVSPTSSEKV